jgi:hypothetical protein
VATSGTYQFGSVPSEQLIVDAYERIGVLPDVMTAQQISTAQRTLNLLLSEWINRGLNLWTVKQEMLGLITNQSAYALPVATSDIQEASIRTSTRQLGGIASASSGIAQNAFDGNSATACTQTAPNGNISYQWGTSIAIQMVGIQSNTLLSYTLVVESSNDGAIWTQALSIAQQSYPVGQIIWSVIPAPSLALYWRVRETGGATLDIQEIYFNTLVNDIPVTRISRSEYMAIPNKNQSGRPSSFFVDRQINPVVYLWPTPSVLYTTLFYTRVRELQDVGAMLDNAEIPQRFFEALVAGLAWKLAMKNLSMGNSSGSYYSAILLTQKLTLLKEEYEGAFNRAAQEDTERVPLRIYGDSRQGWISP